MTERSILVVTHPFQHYKDHVLNYLLPENLPPYALQPPTANPAKDPVAQMRDIFRIVMFPNPWTHGWDNPILKTWDEIYNPQALMEQYDAALAMAARDAMQIIVERAKPYAVVTPLELKFLHDARKRRAAITPTLDEKTLPLDDILTPESTIYVVGDTRHDAANSYRRLHEHHGAKHGRLPPLFCGRTLDADGVKEFCDMTKEFLAAFNKTHSTTLACATCRYG